MKKFLLFVLGIWACGMCAQDIRIYHGENAESVFLKKNDKAENSSKEAVRIVRGVNGIVTVHVLNPNPFFYNYEIKTEDVELKDEYAEQFADLVKLLNAIPDLQTAAENPLKVAPVAGRVAADTKSYNDIILELAVIKGRLQKTSATLKTTLT